ncbi:MAG: hypothetical protein ACI8RZ_005129 [Myxococcota bacterium]|jgi:hypothetical protein
MPLSETMTIHLPVLSTLLRPFQSGGARCGPGLDIDTLDEDTRETVGSILYDIFCESYGELDRETVCDEIIFRPGGQLFLFRDATDTIVGFGCFAIQVVTHAGRVCGVIESGTYMRRGTRGIGSASARRAVVLALVEKLRHPWRPLYWAIEALTPITYRLITRTFPRFYPNRHEATPPEAAGMLSAIIAHRGHQLPTAHPFVISYPDPASHTAPERITLSDAHQADPEIQFYLDQNPRFTDGHILCVLVPFNWREVGAAISRAVTTMLPFRGSDSS